MDPAPLSEEEHLATHQKKMESALDHAVSAAIASCAKEPVRFVSQQLAAQARAEAARVEGFDRELRALGAGCTIEKTEECAISLVQLQAVETNIERRCAKEEWENGPPGGKMVALKAESVNLYDADKFVIRPATVERRCCFVELFAAGPQRPTWSCRTFGASR